MILLGTPRSGVTEDTAPVHILHHLKVGTLRVDLGHDARAQLVHQLAEEDAVLQAVVVGPAHREEECSS